MARRDIDFSTAVSKHGDVHTIELPSYLMASLLDYVTFTEAEMEFYPDGELKGIEGVDSAITMLLREIFKFNIKPVKYDVVISFVDEAMNEAELVKTVGETFKHKEGVYISVREKKTGDGGVPEI